MTALRISLGLATGLVFTAAAIADEARGRIVRIDPDKKELSLETRGPRRGSVLDLQVGPKTQVLVGGQTATLNDLAPGRRIRVVFEKRDGKAVAQVIRTFGLGLAQPQPPARPQPKADLPTPRKVGEGVTGTLQRVALTDREVVVVGPGDKGPQTETTIVVPDEASILRDGKKISFDDLREGETVTIKTAFVKGRLSAVSIQVGQAAAAATPTMPPRRAFIPRLRQALKLADELLQQMEERGKEAAPNRP